MTKPSNSVSAVREQAKRERNYRERDRRVRRERLVRDEDRIYEAGAHQQLVEYWTPRAVKQIYDRRAVLEAVRASGGSIPTKQLLAIIAYGAEAGR